MMNVGEISIVPLPTKFSRALSGVSNDTRSLFIKINDIIKHDIESSSIDADKLNKMNNKYIRFLSRIIEIYMENRILYDLDTVIKSGLLYYVCKYDALRLSSQLTDLSKHKIDLDATSRAEHQLNVKLFAASNNMYAYVNENIIESEIDMHSDFISWNTAIESLKFNKLDRYDTGFDYAIMLLMADNDVVNLKTLMNKKD